MKGISSGTTFSRPFQTSNRNIRLLALLLLFRLFFAVAVAIAIVVCFVSFVFLFLFKSRPLSARQIFVALTRGSGRAFLRHPWNQRRRTTSSNARFFPLFSSCSSSWIMGISFLSFLKYVDIDAIFLVLVDFTSSFPSPTQLRKLQNGLSKCER